MQERLTAYQTGVLQLLGAIVAQAIARSGDQERKAIKLGAAALESVEEILTRDLEGRDDSTNTD